MISSRSGGTLGLAIVATFASACMTMGVPAPLVDLPSVPVEEKGGAGVIGPFSYEVAKERHPAFDLVVARQDRHDSWDFWVSFMGREIGWGTCNQAIRWPMNLDEDRPKWRSDISVTLDCEMTTRTSTSAIKLALRQEAPGDDLAGSVVGGQGRVTVRSTRETKGGTVPTRFRMGYIVELEGVPWAAVQTIYPRMAWLPVPNPEGQQRDLLGLLIVALAGSEEFTEETFAQ